MNRQTQYFIEVEEENFTNRCGEDGNNYPDGSLRGYSCDFADLSLDQLRRFAAENTELHLENLAMFGAATYIGSTLLLNTDGLTGSQTTDMTEVALGASLLRASRALHDPARLSDLHFNAARASACAAAELDGLASVEGRIGEVREDLTSLSERLETIEELRPTVAQARPEPTALIARANAVVAAAAITTEQAVAQIEAYENIQDHGARDLYYRFRDRILQTVRSQRFDLAEIVNLLQSAQSANIALFPSGEPGGASDGNGGNFAPSSDSGRLQTAVTDAEDFIRAVQSKLPDVTARAARLSLCEGLFSEDFVLPPVSTADAEHVTEPAPREDDSDDSDTEAESESGTDE